MPVNMFSCARKTSLLMAMVFVASFSSCQQTNGPVNSPASRTVSEATEPTIEASPTTKGDDQWQVITADKLNLKVNAPSAQSAKILYRPAFAEGHHVEIKRFGSPTDNLGNFSGEMKVPSDFAGEVWAEVSYRDGSRKETKPISLTVDSLSSDELAGASYKHSEVSARSDKLTGGHIERTSLQPGNGDIHITVNIPAFQLTLWQGDKEVKTYEIGIGRKEFPLPEGLRYAKQIVFNPDWIPPDSSWVLDHDVSPGEVVEADDPRNPLGKVKIPIGTGGILIHQAFKPSDLGHLVSHGCVRVQLNELYELIDQLIAARSLHVSKQQLDKVKASKDRFGIKLGAPLVVDITYDTQVVEGGVLHLYPDVYKKRSNGMDAVRAALKDAGVDESAIDDKTLGQMLNRVTMNEQFVVSIADIKAGRVLEGGKTTPLTIASPSKKQPKNSSKPR